MQDTLGEIRARRREYEKDLDYVYDVLVEGTKVAREAGKETMADVKRAMKIDYFDNTDWLKL